MKKRSAGPLGGLLRAAGLAAAAGAALACYSIAIEPRWLQVRRRTVRLPALPPAFDGLKVGMLTDLHAGNWADRSIFERAVDRLRREEVDVAVLTGDVVGHRARPTWAADLEPLARLAAPEGRFAVLGGHDHRNDPEEIAGYLAGLGWRVLLNEKEPLRRGGDTLWIIGVDDNSQLPLHDDLPGACNGLPPGAASVLLAHSPDAVLEARERGLSLVLSGHTHAGQVRLPFVGSLVQVTDLPRRFDDGLSRHGATWLYVSRGVASNYRLRFLCRPDVSVLTLRS